MKKLFTLLLSLSFLVTGQACAAKEKIDLSGEYFSFAKDGLVSMNTKEYSKIFFSNNIEDYVAKDNPDAVIMSFFLVTSLVDAKTESEKQAIFDEMYSQKVLLDKLKQAKVIKNYTPLSAGEIPMSEIESIRGYTIHQSSENPIDDGINVYSLVSYGNANLSECMLFGNVIPLSKKSTAFQPLLIAPENVVLKDKTIDIKNFCNGNKVKTGLNMLNNMFLAKEKNAKALDVKNTNTTTAAKSKGTKLNTSASTTDIESRAKEIAALPAADKLKMLKAEFLNLKPVQRIQLKKKLLEMMKK